MTREIQIQPDPKVVDQNKQPDETSIYQLLNWCQLVCGNGGNFENLYFL